MRRSNNVARLVAALLMLMVTGAALLSWNGEEAGAVPAEKEQVLSPASERPSLRADAPAAQENDPQILAVEPIQVLTGEPLILGKSTVVRVLVGSGASAEQPLELGVAVDFDGQVLEQTAQLTQTEQYVDFYPEAPAELRTIGVLASITPGEGVADENAENNEMEVSVPTIRMPDTMVKIFYLPVDWTGEQREINEFDTYFPAYTKENTDFVRATYPLPDAQVVAESTDVPHMLTPEERALADENYKSDPAARMRFGGSIALTARQYAPDAELIAAVLPPHWLQRYVSRSALGFAHSAFPGMTFVLLFGPRTMVIGHEYGHIRNLIDDYDFGGTREVKGYHIDRPGFWVEKKRPIAHAETWEIYNMMSSAVFDGNYDYFWLDSRSYDHLIANYISAGGESSEPLVLAATVVDPRRVTSAGAPLFAAAGQNIWEPDATVGLSVATIGTKKSDKIRVVWKRAGEVLAEEEKNSPGPQFGYTNFRMTGEGRDGLALGRHEVETYLNGNLVKTGRFFVQPGWTPAFDTPLGDNEPDNSRGYRAGTGVATAKEAQEGMLVKVANTRQRELYAWFVAAADGESRPKSFDVDMKFVGPDGKEYSGQWVDDGKVTAGPTLSDASIARKTLKIAGTDVARQPGPWSVKVIVDGKQVATDTFSLLNLAGGSREDAADGLLDALGYHLISIRAREVATDTTQSNFTMAVDPISEDLGSPEFIKQVWDSFQVIDMVDPSWPVYRVRMPVTERHSIYFKLRREGWRELAEEEPSWDTLRDHPAFIVEVRDDLRTQYLPEEDAVSFLEDRLR